MHSVKNALLVYLQKAVDPCISKLKLGPVKQENLDFIAFLLQTCGSNISSNIHSS